MKKYWVCCWQLVSQHDTRAEAQADLERLRGKVRGFKGWTVEEVHEAEAIPGPDRVPAPAPAPAPEAPQAASL